MKNSIKLLALAAICAVAVSCKNEPSTMSYTLSATFNNVAENPQYYPVVDSLFYREYVLLDSYSALCTSCEDLNNGFVGGWKVSLKKGDASEPAEQQMFSSAGQFVGFSKNQAYAVYTSSPKDYDIVFKYSEYFTKSSCNVVGFYINNTKYVETLAEKGLIADGDYLKVTATFYKGSLPVCTEEYYLVDYSGTEKKIVKDWTAWEMENARKCDVDAVKFAVSSASGTLPESFCLDFLVASISVEY